MHAFAISPSFGHPLPAIPPHLALVHAAALNVVHVCAHGAGEGEANAGRRLLRHLVSAAEVHGKDILGQSRDGGRSEAA